VRFPNGGGFSPRCSKIVGKNTPEILILEKRGFEKVGFPPRVFLRGLFGKTPWGFAGLKGIRPP